MGQAKLLRHEGNRRIRFLFRQEKTLKIRGNHIVMPGTHVQEHTGSDKSMVWSCVDFSEEVQRMELFCIRFATPERAAQFKAAYESAAADMEAVLEQQEGGEEGGEEPAPQADDASEKDVDKLADSLGAGAKVQDDAAATTAEGAEPKAE